MQAVGGFNYSVIWSQHVLVFSITVEISVGEILIYNAGIYVRALFKYPSTLIIYSHRCINVLPEKTSPQDVDV